MGSPQSREGCLLARSLFPVSLRSQVRSLSRPRKDVHSPNKPTARRSWCLLSSENLDELYWYLYLYQYVFRRAVRGRAPRLSPNILECERLTRFGRHHFRLRSSTSLFGE